MTSNDLPPDPNHHDEEFDDEGTVTMVDVLKAEEIMEENADAVLGPGDDKNCTYKEGFLKRQPLYACLTCVPPEGKQSAGICLACSYHCHGDHDLVELYTKRNFRCDCGNDLFKGVPCTLDPFKNASNDKNIYNHNFQRIYCSCRRPYPDPDDPVDDAMHQCIVCEDWFHTRHLGSSLPNDDDYAEMICGPCTDRLPFLKYYLGHSVCKVSNADESSASLNVTDNETVTSPKKQVIQNGTDGQKIWSESPENHATGNDEVKGEISDPDNVQELSMPAENITEKSLSEITTKPDDITNESVVTSSPTDKEKEEKGCLLKGLRMLPKVSGATFWPEGFRKLLCTCASCIEMYKSLDVGFLPDEDDTVQAYEEKGESKRQPKGQYERGMQALSSLDRVQQMEAILGYNDLKSHLSEYLAKFVKNKKVVREEDIREFFSGMQARKRQKLDIPHNCR